MCPVRTDPVLPSLKLLPHPGQSTVSGPADALSNSREHSGQPKCIIELMNVASIGVIISFLISVAAPAQTFEQQQLADFAREERQRRAALGVAAEGSVTNENVIRAGFPVFIGRVGSVVPGAPAAEDDPAVETDVDETTAEGATDDPLAALAEQIQIVQALQDEEVLLQLDMNRLRAQFQAPVASQRERNEASEGIAAVAEDLDALRIELAEAREVLEALETAASAEISVP